MKMRYAALGPGNVCAMAVGLWLAGTPSFAEIVLTDVTLEAGLAAESYYSVSSHSLGVVWIDFNNDDLPDLLATNGYGTSGPHLYINNGDGSFARRDRLLPELEDWEFPGARSADYDNDGDADLFLYTAHEQWDISGFDNPPDGPPNLLLKNNFVENGGVLTEPLFEDVAAAAGVDDCPQIPLGPDYGCFQARTAAFLDYDMDGCVDLFVGHLRMNLPRQLENRNALYRNNCDGTFDNVTDPSNVDSDSDKWRPTLVVSAADFNADGCPDLYVGNVGNHESLAVEDFNDVMLENQCDGTFSEVEEGHGDDTPAAMGIDIADLSLNGKFEIYITDVFDHKVIKHDPGNTLYIYKRDGSLSENLAPVAGVAAASSWGTNFLDVDRDGDEDLFVGLSEGWGYSVLHENRGARGFRQRGLDVGLATGLVRGSALADYDRDGDLDIVIVNQDGPLQLFRNDSDAVGGWLRVKLVATRSNPDAFGAIVEMTARGYTFRRQLKGGTSAHSQDYGEVFFGVPGNEAPQRVRVLWPSGAESIIEPVEEHVLTVVEPLS